MNLVKVAFDKRLKNYIQLMRLDKPIGIFLLLWPTLWALWIAGDGKPDTTIVILFIIGVILMRSAGCIVNDIADRKFDKFVTRTKQRPLAANKLNVKQAMLLFFCLLLFSFLIALCFNLLTIKLAFIGVALAIIYPFLKRITHLPQVGLGLAFSWGVPMAFAAVDNIITADVWCLFAASATWPIIYDTMYAMVDRDDDIHVGVKSTAIAWGDQEKLIIGFFQLFFLMLMSLCGFIFHLKWIYFFSLGLASLLFMWQQFLIKDRDKDKCLHAFLNNHWVGLIIYVGIMLSYLV